MSRRRFLAVLTGAVLGGAFLGCSGSNPNERGFETEGVIDPNIPVDAEEYEKKFQKQPAPRGKGGRLAPSDI